MLSKLSPGELVFLIVLLAALSVLVQLAVAKALWERKQARLKRERAEAERARPPDAP